jgi:hypothetical protein
MPLPLSNLDEEKLLQFINSVVTRDFFRSLTDVHNDS